MSIALILYICNIVLTSVVKFILAVHVGCVMVQEVYNDKHVDHVKNLRNYENTVC